MFKIVKPSEIDTVLGTEVGVSDWVTIDQERIDKFADATMDHQFIHVDPEQATPVLDQLSRMDFFHSQWLLEYLLIKK